jgi:hypothetical protein
MKGIHFLATGALVIIVSITAAICGVHNSSIPKNSIKGVGFVVLELFTSEGCSSCPPADELLAKIKQEAGDKQVYILAYHVDYWNRLGWKDVFSNPDFSARQYKYSKQLNAQVYTPQLIINGKAEFIGSDEPAIRRTMREVLSETTGTLVILEEKTEGGKLTINYQTKGHFKNAELTIAIVEKHAVREIKNGENAGRTLSHIQIVERLVSFDISSEKSIVIDLPKGFNSKDWEVLGLLQNSQSGEIYAASRMELKQ